MADEKIVLEIADRIAPTIKARIVEIGIAAHISQNQVDKLQSSLDTMNASKLATSLNATAIAEQKLAAATAKTSQAQAQAATAVARLASAEANVAKSLAQAEAAQNRTAASALKLAQAQNQNSQSANNTGNAIMTLTKGFLGYQAVKAAIVTTVQLTDSYTALQNKLLTVTKDFGATVPLMSQLRDISNETYTPIDATASAFSRFSRALTSVGRGQSEAIPLTKTINQLLRASGASASESGSALLQLSQAFNKGKLDGDEFRTVMELMPAAADAIAKSLGVTRGELLKLAPEGKITTNIMIDAFKAAGSEIDKLPQPVMTLADAFTILKNNAVIFFGELEQGSGIVDRMARGIKRLADVMAKSPTADVENSADFKKDIMAAQNKRGLFDFVDSDDSEYQAILQKHLARKAQADWELGNKQKQLEATQAQTFAQEQENKAVNNKASALQKATQELERETELSRMTDKQRAVEQEFDRKRNELAKEGVTLNDEQAKSIKNIIAANQARMQKSGGSKGEKGPDRAAILAKINAQLDNQLERTFMLTNERDKQSKFDQIEENLMGRKITLNAEEAKAIQAKIAANQEAAIVQGEFDRLYQESVGPMNAYNATVAANNKLLDMGQVSQERYARNLLIARDAYALALDPMFETNKAYKEQLALLQFNSREREIEASVLQIANDQRSKGIILSSQELDRLRARAIEMRNLTELRAAEDSFLEASIGKQRELNTQLEAFKNTRAQLKDAGMQNTALLGVQNDNGLDTSGATATSLAAAEEAREAGYKRVDEMRRQDLINEQEAEMFKVRLWQQSQKLKLDAASTFFSAFEGMQRSNIEEFATIGKAAAIANATIATYQAANSAYAAMAGIPTVGPALGAAAAAGAIASGMANVAAIASQPTGFKAGGYTGGGNSSDVAGVVHAREYVMDAATTARLGRGNLDALRQGDASGVADKSSGAGNTIQLTVVVVGSEQEARDFVKGKEGEAVIVNAVMKNAKTLAKTFKAAG